MSTLLLIGAVLGLPLLLAVGSLRAATLVLGGVAAACMVLGVALTGRGRAADLLLLSFWALVFVPLDKYFRYQEHVGGWSGVRVSAADLPLLLLIPVVVLGVVLGRTENRLPGWVILAYALLVLQYLLSSVGATYGDLVAFELLGALHAFAIAVVVAALVRYRHVHRVLAVVAILMLLHSSFGIAQAATGRPLGAAWLGGPDVLMQEELLTGTVRVRPAGLLTHPVTYAGLFVVTLPALAAGALSVGQRWLSALLTVSLLVGAVGLALTLSRGAWISTAFGMGILVLAGTWRGLLRRAVIRRFTIAAVGVGVISLAFAPIAWERLTASQSGNVDVRLELNEIALRMVGAHPLTGVGLNNFLPMMEGYDPEDVAEYFPAAVHNIYLLEASEAGIPAMILITILLVGIPVAGLRATRDMSDPHLKWLVIGLSAGLLGFALSQVADFSHRLEPLRSIIWCEVGLLFALVGEDRRRRSLPSPTSSEV